MPAVITRLNIFWNGNDARSTLRVTTDGTQDTATLRGGYALPYVLLQIADTIATEVNAQIVTWGGADTIAGSGGMIFQPPTDRCWMHFWFTAGPTAGPVQIYAEFDADFGAQIGTTRIGLIEVLSADATQPNTTSWDRPRVNRLRPNQTSILCYEDPEKADTFPAGPGYAKLEYTPPDEGASMQTEVLYYLTKTVVDATARTFTLDGCIRGRFDTTPIEAEFPPGFAADGPEITSCFGWDDVGLGGGALNVGAHLLMMLTSTGTGAMATPGEFGAYDLGPAYAGLAIDPAAIDVQSFVSALLDQPFAERALLLDKPLKFGEFVSKTGVFHGFIFGGRTDASGRFRLGLTRVPVLSLGGQAIALSDQYDGGLIAVRPKARSAKTAITQILVRADYDPITNDFRGEPVTVRYASGRMRRPDGETAEIEVPGLVSGDPYGAARTVADRLFWVWGEQRTIIEFDADRRMLMTAPGQLITLTVAGILTPYGARGLTATPAILIGIEKNWFRPGEPPCHCKAIVIGDYGASRGLAPTFNVTIAVTDVTIADNVYTEEGDPIPWDGYTECRDWMYGPGPDEAHVWTFWVRGDYANRVNAEVMYSSDGVVTLGAALGIAANRAEYAPWATVGRHADQDDFVHIADTSGDLGVTPSDFKWTA